MHYTTSIQLMSNADSNSIYIKREDFIPFSFGGNKARKASLYKQDIISKKADYIVTYGSNNSNHCRVIANMGAALGLPCLIITPETTERQTLNTKLCKLFNAKIAVCSLEKVADTIELYTNTLREEGYQPYFIQGGGHGNLGTHAYVQCFDEIVAYEQANEIKFDYIFLASGTGTTQAGLICGKILKKSNVRVIGISIARKNPYGSDVIKQSVIDYMKSKGQLNIADYNIEFYDDYIVNGYGTYNKEILDTIKTVMTQYGIALSATYTGKAFWGMQEFIRKHNIIGKNILFLHTGGVPLFFDDMEKLYD